MTEPSQDDLAAETAAALEQIRGQVEKRIDEGARPFERLSVDDNTVWGDWP